MKTDRDRRSETKIIHSLASLLVVIVMMKGLDFYSCRHNTNKRANPQDFFKIGCNWGVIQKMHLMYQVFRVPCRICKNALNWQFI